MKEKKKDQGSGTAVNGVDQEPQAEPERQVGGLTLDICCLDKDLQDRILAEQCSYSHSTLIQFVG